jgi:hypothetical protein
VRVTVALEVVPVDRGEDEGGYGGWRRRRRRGRGFVFFVGAASS